MTGRLATTGSAVILLLVGACGGGDTGAAEAASAFGAALGAGDAARACELLAPATRSLLEYQESQSCAQAIGERKLSSGAVQAVEVWGGEAQVRTSADTWFLTRTGQGWRVAAAGCVAHGDAPYTCKVNGS